MAPRRSSMVDSWFRLAKKTARVSQRLGKAAGAQAKRQLPEVQKTAKWLLSGVATPAPDPAISGRGKGRWEEGRWGLGPLAMRRYRLFLPQGAGVRHPVPLVVLLHGCGQDSASFAAATRAAAAARSGGYAVLLPEQSSEANPQRCWNWFGPDSVVAAEVEILRAIVEHVCATHPVRRRQVFVIGLSAGGAMALTLALRHPGLFAAVGSHAGAVPHSASNALQAGQAMRGRRQPETESLRRRLAGRGLPPLLVLHGEADHAVAIANAEAAVAMWLQLAREGARIASASRGIARGARHPCHVTDWTQDGRPYARLVRIAGLGHAWSGGAAKQAFSDPRGPDALRMAWRFFSRCAV